MEWRGSENFANLPPIVNAKHPFAAGIFGFSQTADRAKEIAMSANQQIGGSKQISDAMTNIDEAMKQIAVGAQQNQTAVKQLAELGKELDGLMKMLK